MGLFSNNGRWVLGPGIKRLGGVGAGQLPDEAVNKAQLDTAINSTFEGNNNAFTGNNTHSGTETFSNAAGVTTDVVTERTADAGVTVDSVLLKDGGVSNAGVTMFAGFFPVAAQESKSGAGAINVTSYSTLLTTTGADALTLAAGTQIGQRKRIRMIVDGGDGTLTLTGYTSIVFNDANDEVELIWSGAAWFVLYNLGCTVNT